MSEHSHQGYCFTYEQCGGCHRCQPQTLALTDFLLARIAEEQFLAEAIVESGVSQTRVLAECETKRRIVELHLGWGRVDSGSYADMVLRLLALPYADHPDFREEWKR